MFKSEKIKNPKLTASGGIATKITQHFEVQNNMKIFQTDYQAKSYLIERFYTYTTSYFPQGSTNCHNRSKFYLIITKMHKTCN